MTVALPNAVKGLSEVISCKLFVTVLTTKYILNPHGTYRKPSKTTKLFTVGLLLNCERKHIQYNFQKTSPWNNSGRANSERWVPAGLHRLSVSPQRDIEGGTDTGLQKMWLQGSLPPVSG